MASPHSSIISSTIINLHSNIIYQHARLSLQVEFTFILEQEESGTCACSDEENVSRQILVMETCIRSHKFVWYPSATDFIQSTQQVFCLIQAFYHFIYQSIRPTVFYNVSSVLKICFSQLLILLLNNARHGIGLIKMVHNPHDSIAQPCTVGHTRKSKLINFVSFPVYNIYPAKQTTV